MPKVPLPDSPEKAQKIKEHYLLEKELARRFIDCKREDRTNMLSGLYDELFEKIPHHPRLKVSKDPEVQRLRIEKKLKGLKKFIRPDDTFLEVGTGDGALSILLSKYVKKVYALDVTDVIINKENLPQNVEIVIADGAFIPLPDNSVDIAFSDQLIEHLHPEDCIHHFEGIYKILKENGRYFFLTPNRLSGPHDVSRYFDDVATGFHLKEWTFQELEKSLKSVGFKKFEAFISVKGNYISVPWFLKIFLEKIVQLVPKKLGDKIGNSFLFNYLSNIIILAKK